MSVIDKNGDKFGASGLLASVAAPMLGVDTSKIIEIAALAFAKPDSIRLFAGESDEPTPAFIVKAAEAAMAAGQTRYTLSQGTPELREEIAAYSSRLYGRPIDAARVTVTVGGMQALSQTLLALLEPGEEVLIPVPVWPNILEATKVARAVPRAVPLSFDPVTGWSLDLNKMLAAVTPQTKVVFINSPSNPTGWVASRAEMQALLDFCRARGLWLISDEVYGRMVYDDLGRATSMLDLIEADDRVVVCNTMSKNWSMTGWRVGWVIAPAELGPVYDNLMQYGSTGVTTFVQHAAVVALRDGEEHVRQMTAQCAAGRDIISAALSSIPGVRYVAPRGAFYAFFGIEGMRDSRAVAFDLLDKEGVALAPGAAFGAEGEGWLRLCFGVSHKTLNEASDRLIRYFGQAG